MEDVLVKENTELLSHASGTTISSLPGKKKKFLKAIKI